MLQGKRERTYAGLRRAIRFMAPLQNPMVGGCTQRFFHVALKNKRPGPLSLSRASENLQENHWQREDFPLPCTITRRYRKYRAVNGRWLRGLHVTQLWNSEEIEGQKLETPVAREETRGPMLSYVAGPVKSKLKHIVFSILPFLQKFLKMLRTLFLSCFSYPIVFEWVPLKSKG